MTPLEKEEPENTQSDQETPSDLSGVMSRWVVPEGEEERESVITKIPVPQPDIEEIPLLHEEVSGRRPPSPFAYTFFKVGFFVLLLLSLFLLFLKK